MKFGCQMSLLGVPARCTISKGHHFIYAVVEFLRPSLSSSTCFQRFLSTSWSKRSHIWCYSQDILIYLSGSRILHPRCYTLFDFDLLYHNWNICYPDSVLPPWSGKLVKCVLCTIKLTKSRVFFFLFFISFHIRKKSIIESTLNPWSLEVGWWWLLRVPCVKNLKSRSK